jgi:hypothetical protein
MITYSNNGSRKALLKNRSIDNIDIIITYENNRFINFDNNEFPLILAITTTRRVCLAIYKDLFYKLYNKRIVMNQL